MAHPKVTLHAVRRFAECILDIGGLPEKDAEAIAALRSDHGIDSVIVRQNLARIVRRGVEYGAPVVLYGRARFILEGEFLVTVEHAFGRWDRRSRHLKFDADDEWS